MITEIEETMKVVERLLECELQEGREFWLCCLLLYSQDLDQCLVHGGRLSSCLLAC